jgi:predicted nucleic acid-binding protein
VIVLDASAALELILAQPGADRLARTLAAHDEVHVPEHFHIEAISGLRRLVLHGGLDEVAGIRALEALERLRAVRYPVLPLSAAVWALRDRLSAYDAAYLALAVALDADLVSCDAGLAEAARAAGRSAPA